MASKRSPRRNVRTLSALSPKLDFEALVRSIIDLHESVRSQATKAVNVYLTFRNWLIGWHLREYEQNGKDRAAYGDRLFERLAERLQERGVPRADDRELRRYRRFYEEYPMIREALPPELAQKIAASSSRAIRESANPKFKLDGRTLVDRLSFTHFAELLQIDEPLKRAFYEVECVKGNWAVRELKRQIASLYYERAGLSRDKQKLSKLTQAKAQPQTAKDIVRDPYVFEFLGLKSKEVMGESDLEDALLDKLENFLLELGHGFCFEARQKRIVIGGQHCFIDLVFYHRILKCHVLIELKADDFKHEHLGQLNTYVSWYGKHEMSRGDSPPIGILLCTTKNHAMVEYALAGIDNRLFVSKYQLELPKKEEIQRFLEKQIGDTVKE